MKTQKIAKIRKTKRSAHVGDTLIYEEQHPKIEDCEEWRVVYITQNHMAILVSKGYWCSLLLFSKAIQLSSAFLKQTIIMS
jgi:hypothetical protein